MSAMAQHNESRKPDTRAHEAEKPGGVGASALHKITDTHKKSSAEQTDSTEKELRRMSRSELIEVIYALEQDNQSLQKENEKLRSELNDKDIRIATSGSIAEAALSLNHIFEDAQAAADQYLSSIKNAQSSPTTPHTRHTS